LRDVVEVHFTPVKPLPKTEPSLKTSLMTIVTASCECSSRWWSCTRLISMLGLNLLLVFIPVGWALHFINATPVAVFVSKCRERLHAFAPG
jgi:hypothetical protein